MKDLQMFVETSLAHDNEIEWTEGYKWRTQDLLLPEHRERAYKNHLIINSKKYLQQKPVCKWSCLTHEHPKLLLCSIDQKVPDVAWIICDFGGGYVGFDGVFISKLSEYTHSIYKFHDFERDIK